MTTGGRFIFPEGSRKYNLWAPFCVCMCEPFTSIAAMKSMGAKSLVCHSFRACILPLYILVGCPCRFPPSEAVSDSRNLKQVDLTGNIRCV